VDFPSTDDFLDAFGIVPIEEDPSIAYCRYVKISSDGQVELDFSFNAAMESFQVVLRCGGKKTVTISSERVKQIKIRKTHTGSNIQVIFDVREGTSEAVLSFEPELYCHWWSLRN
jgi:hypothetical protein